jgi:hypothetical protein
LFARSLARSLTLVDIFVFFMKTKAFTHHTNTRWILSSDLLPPKNIYLYDNGANRTKLCEFVCDGDGCYVIIYLKNYISITLSANLMKEKSLHLFFLPPSPHRANKLLLYFIMLVVTIIVIISHFSSKE